MFQGLPRTEAAPLGSDEFWFGSVHGTEVVQYADLRENPEVLGSGLWAVIGEFNGPIHAWRMDRHHSCPSLEACVIPVTREVGGPGSWSGPHVRDWRSSLDRGEYCARVDAVRNFIDAGRVDQLNLCRVLSVPVSHPPPAAAFQRRIAREHPAPYAGWFSFRSGPGAWLVSASPELAASVRAGRLRSAPIKGTAPSEAELAAKDYTENRLVTAELHTRLQDLCTEVDTIGSLKVESHPGLVQLVSTLEGTLRSDPATDPAAWAEVLALMHPPLSVAGVPLGPALTAIAELEGVERGPYCGSIGWIDADRGQCLLAAAIRCFWWTEGKLNFGTGAGITAASDPQREWQETELKAQRLLQLAADVPSGERNR